MSAINNERSGRDDNNEINIANAVENVDNDIRGPSDKNLLAEDRGHYTGDPERIKDSNSVDVPPDGGYGWVCVACVFLINGHTWGVNSSYGVFLAHYLGSDTFPGATSLEYAFVGGLSISLALLTAPVATSCTRKFGTRVTLAIGIVLETAGLLGASFAYEIWHLFLSQGVAFGFGMGFLFVGSVGVVPQWFSKRRSLANGISAAGSGLGGLIYSLATNAMIQSIGLGWAFRVLAILAFAVNTVCTILVRDRNHAIGSVQKAFDIQLFKKPEFFLLLGWGFFSMLAYIVLLFSLPNYARSIGLSAKQGSVIGAILNLGQGLGRPFVGAFSDATGRINMAGTCTFLAGLFCLVIWIFAKSYGVLIFFALIVGTVSGTFWATVAPVGAEVVGLKVLPSALSIIWLVLVIPCTFSEPIGLKLRASSGDIYLHAQVYAGCMYIGAALCMWGLRAWKIKELESLREGEREKEIRDEDEARREREREQGEGKISEEGANVPMRRQMTRTESVKRATKGLWVLQRV
ncbi:hypothetical protein BGAL_0216g00160 [Botrytis galanthina]|uniref:Major facilitator superfamily (MFS) profile domain-containing protein n=1 Tax=Botrytis galanthina TaxID=278940 RepID=A0A4S8QY17_9HELO|nr:hypothetical protein BGAL_0216g00160 [Botrytis galanthina]